LWGRRGKERSVENEDIKGNRVGEEGKKRSEENEDIKGNIVGEEGKERSVENEDIKIILCIIRLCINILK